MPHTNNCLDCDKPISRFIVDKYGGICGSCAKDMIEPEDEQHFKNM